MPGHVPGIHVFTPLIEAKTWMAGSSPAMTTNSRLCEERSDEAIQPFFATLDCFAALAMTVSIGGRYLSPHPEERDFARLEG